MQPIRVVVTGLGAVTPVGVDQPSTWEALVAGRSGIGPITHFDAAGLGFEVRVAAEVNAFDPAVAIDAKSARRMDRVTQLAVVASREALADAGLLDGASGRLDRAWHAPERVGAFIGSGMGGIVSFLGEHDVLTGRGARRVSPFTIPMVLIDSIPGTVAIQFGLKGPNMAHVSACASGANAIGEAFEAIRRGAADVMVAGGSEAAITPLVVAGFQNMGALSKWQGEPRLASRPFDAARDGFVMGEGAGILVFEEYEHAKKRGANIYCEVLGYGMSADANHITQPDECGRGGAAAMRFALADAGIAPDQIDYINAHGTGTPLGDVAETVAIKSVFGDHARKLKVSSTKSSIGHLLGASGGVELIATVMAIRNSVISPTINLDHPGEGCDLDYTPRVPQDARVNMAISNSFGFGGHNACIAVGRLA